MSLDGQRERPAESVDESATASASTPSPALSLWTVQPGAHTFDSAKIRQWAERYLTGTVLNLCAGPTELTHDGPVIRNDIDATLETDLSVDAQLISSCLPDNSVETVVFDPPFSEHQATTTYGVDDEHVLPPGGAVLHEIDRVLRPGGTFIHIGFQTPGMPPEFGYTTRVYTIFNLLGRQHDWIGVVQEKPDRETPPEAGYAQSVTEKSGLPESRILGDSMCQSSGNDIATYDISPN